MSFSSELKQELSKIPNLTNKEQLKYELIGYLKSSNTSLLTNSKLKFSTESEYNINRFSRLLSNMEIKNFSINLQGKSYVIEVPKKEIEKADLKLDIKDTKNIELQKALVRGIFLGSGSMNNPENNYHLEMNLSSEKDAQDIENLLKNIDINVKLLENKTIYIKDGEEISKFLAFIGAKKTVLKFEEIRVNHEMSNKINRIVNCESANLNKIMNASIEQIDAINKLKKHGKFETLDDNLKEIAEIRLENPNLNLAELGKLLSNPIGKSGVNYRLKKIVELSKNNN